MRSARAFAWKKPRGVAHSAPSGMWNNSISIVALRCSSGFFSTWRTERACFSRNSGSRPEGPIRADPAPDF